MTRQRSPRTFRGILATALARNAALMVAAVLTYATLASTTLSLG